MREIVVNIEHICRRVSKGTLCAFKPVSRILSNVRPAFMLLAELNRAETASTSCTPDDDSSLEIIQTCH